jgi:transposase
MYNVANPYISIGIDVAADDSIVCIMLPSFETIGKPFKVVHTDLGSLEKVVSAIKKAEDKFQMKSQIFLESTGIFHFPLFCFLKNEGFEVFVLNPLITHSTKNADIRKVKNDKFDSIKIAKIGLDPKTKKSVIADEFVLNLRLQTRQYYVFSDDRTALINRLSNHVHLAFPAFKGIFSDLAGGTSLAVLRSVSSLEQFLSADRNNMIAFIAKSARKGEAYAAKKFDAIIEAVHISQKLTFNLPDVFPAIHAFIDQIALIDSQMDDIFKRISAIVAANESHPFVKQIRLIDAIPGAGFLSAVTLMCEIGDFSVFKNPKQLFAYFGLDPSVNESGKFKGTKNHMSKRGSRLARRIIYTIALASIRDKRNGQPFNPVLQAFYQEKVKSKLKKVALGAVMHKVCKIIFAVLRDEADFVIRTPEEHIKLYNVLAA